MFETKRTTFKKLSAYYGRSFSQKEGLLSRFDEWKYINTEKLKIKKYFQSKEPKTPHGLDHRDSRYVSIDPIFENEIKKDKLKDNSILPREPEIVEINAIPLGITEDDKLICLDEQDEMPTIFISGQVGSGKTILAHRLCDYMYNLMDYRLIIGNDWKTETKHWTRPNYMLMPLLGEGRLGLPIMTFLPAIKNRLMDRRAISTPTVLTAIDWNHFIDRIDTFADLGASGKYLMKMREDIKVVENMEQLKLRLREYMPDKSAVAIRNKIMATFEKYHELGLIEPKYDASKWNMGAGIGTGKLAAFQGDNLILDEDLPFIIATRLGLVSVINTSDLQIHEEHYQRLMKFWFDWLIDRKNKDSDFKREKTMVYIDELSTFCSKKKSIAMTSIKSMIQRGRMLNLGAILVTQNIAEIPPEISTNCKFNIIFEMPSDRDTTLLARNLNLDKKYKNMIKELNKFECVLISREKPFLIYDLENNEYYYEAGVFKVHTFFSLGEHEGGQNQDSAEKIRSGHGEFGYWVRYAMKVLQDKGIELNISRERNTTGNLNYRERESSIEEHMLQKQELFKKPRIIEGCSVAREFYKREDVMQTITYNELKNFGFLVVTMPNGYYSIVKKSDVKNNMVIHNSLPKDIYYIIYNQFTKKARLVGYSVLHTGITIAPMVNR